MPTTFVARRTLHFTYLTIDDTYKLTLPVNAMSVFV
jgi:hypothetical protein